MQGQQQQITAHSAVVPPQNSPNLALFLELLLVGLLLLPPSSVLEEQKELEDEPLCSKNCRRWTDVGVLKFIWRDII